MRIGLFGISGVYNFGCEAIVRGATGLIRRLYPRADIKYFTHNYDYDCRILSDLGIEIVKIEEKVNILNRATSKLCRIIHTEHRPLFMNTEKILRQVDVIWSIGGDIYTIPEHRRRNPKYEYYNAIADFCDRAVEAGKNVILYGASVGPFGEYDKAVSYYIKNLRQYKLIMCRELDTFSYLKQCSLQNIIFFPDPAFQVHGNSKEYKEKKYIGFNISPLSLKELYGEASIENKKKIANLIERIIDVFNISILMIPHVVSKSESDDDLRFQKQLVDIVDEEHRGRIYIADYSGGFLGLKSQIQQCKFVIAARMHCAINALVENVPAIMLSYSKKSVGMGQYIYNSNKWTLSLKDIDVGLIPLMCEMAGIEEELSKYLNKRNSEINQEYERLIDTLKNRIGV